jgi:hypothetical protein
MKTEKLFNSTDEHFRMMPPSRHSADPASSSVIQKIMDALDCDIDDAVKTFDRLRNWSQNILVFDRIACVWHGRDWRPDDETTEDALRREVAVLIAEVRRLRQEVNSIHKGFNKPFHRNKSKNFYGKI